MMIDTLDDIRKSPERLIHSPHAIIPCPAGVLRSSPLAWIYLPGVCNRKILRSAGMLGTAPLFKSFPHIHLNGGGHMDKQIDADSGMQ